MTANVAKNKRIREFGIAAGLSLVAALVFYFSTKPKLQHFDYTARIALALMDGHLGMQSRPPSWLNEMVPFNGNSYSVFPPGAVLSMFPVALCRKQAGSTNFPGRAVAALIAGLCVFFFFRLSSLEGKSLGGRVLLALFPIFGTWAWCNLGSGGAWQIAPVLPAWSRRRTLFHAGSTASPHCRGILCPGVRQSNRTNSYPACLRLFVIGAAGQWQCPPRREGEAMVAEKLASDDRLRSPAANAWSLDRGI